MCTETEQVGKFKKN